MRPERRFERRNGTGGRDVAAARTHTDPDPSEANLLRTNIGLDKGVHFTIRQKSPRSSAGKCRAMEQWLYYQKALPEDNAMRLSALLFALACVCFGQTNGPLNLIGTAINTTNPEN